MERHTCLTLWLWTNHTVHAEIGRAEIVEQTPKTRMCWLVEKTNSTTIWKTTAQSWRTPKVRGTRRRRWEEKLGGDEKKRKTETSNTDAARTVNDSPLANCHIKDRTATRKMQRKKRRTKAEWAGTLEQADIIVKCEGSKGDEERNIKQREGGRTQKRNQGRHRCSWSAQRTRGILKIGSS